MLSLDPAEIIFQVINFLVLAWVLNRFLFQPVLRQAAQREEDRNRLMNDLAEERRQLAVLRADLEHKEENLHDDFERLRVEVREEAETERQELLKQARGEAAKMLVEAQLDARRLRQQSVDQFREDLVGAVLDVTATLARRMCPPEVHSRLVAQLSERIRELGRSEMARVEAVRRSLSDREAVAYITAAHELSTEQQSQLVRLLTALADKHVEVQLKIDESLVAGLRVRLGDTVMDSSFAGQLTELREMVAAALKEQIDRG